MIGLGWNKNLEQNTSSHGMLYVLKRLADVKRCVAVPSEWGLHKKVSRRTQQSICFNGYLAPVKANICTTTLQAQQIYLLNNNKGTTNIFAQQQHRHNIYICTTTIGAQQYICTTKCFHTTNYLQLPWLNTCCCVCFSISIQTLKCNTIKNCTL